jgi:hypothetical protein
MRALIIATLTIAMTSGVAFAQTTSMAHSTKSMSHMKSSHMMKHKSRTGKHTMPKQRRSTMTKTMKKSGT